MARGLGIECKKQEVYLAVADDGELVAHALQRLEAPSIMEANERLTGFLTSFRHALDEIGPDEVRILQPEQTYQGSYSDFAPKVALETAARIACEERRIPVEVLHRSRARSRLGYPRSGSLDTHINERRAPRPYFIRACACSRKSPHGAGFRSRVVVRLIRGNQRRPLLPRHSPRPLSFPTAGFLTVRR
jgi:hypothetical protein